MSSNKPRKPRSEWTKEERKLLTFSEGNPERFRLLRRSSVLILLALVVSSVTRQFVRDGPSGVWVPVIAVAVLLLLAAWFSFFKAVRLPHKPKDK